MAAHKYWQALCMASPTPDTLELSEFHLYSAGVRVDATATLVSSTAPTGALANLKDANAATGCLWSTGGADVVLTWEFPMPQAVDGIVLGSRTAVARWPTSLVLRGGDAATGSGPSPEYVEWQAYPMPYFVASSKTPVLTPGPAVRSLAVQTRGVDLQICGGAGYVPYQIDREVLPATNPKTYVPQWARVQLARFIDGRVIQEQWSDRATGAGTFHNVDENFLYTVTAIYPETGMRAVVADRLQPLVYPS